ncbi:MAG: alpha/beta hydrolase [Halobacteriaceae archaeon]
MGEAVLLPGAREATGTLDDPGGADGAVVACPPHPEMGGRGTDRRLRAVSDALGERGVACLRFDYGPWDEGYGEREDARDAVRWAADEFERVGLFGFSFGATVAALAAATVEVDLAAVSLLAPTARVSTDLDAVAALDGVRAPLQVVCGARDETVDWEPVAERARELGATVVELPADHFFVGQDAAYAPVVADFLADALTGDF